MIHGHYKGLATKAEAEKWFNVNLQRPKISFRSRKILAMKRKQKAANAWKW